MTTDLPEAPAYFSRDVRINREGPDEPRGPAGTRRAFSGGARGEAALGRVPPRRARSGGVRHRPRRREPCTSASAGSSRRGRARSSRRRPPSSSSRKTRGRSPRRGRVWRASASRMWRATSAAGSWRGTGRADRLRARSRSVWTSCAPASRRAADLQVLDVRRPRGVAGGPHRARRARPPQRARDSRRGARPEASRRDHLRERLSLVHRGEHAREVGPVRGGQRRWWHEGLERGEVRRQYAVSGQQ